MKKSQKDKVLDHILKFGKITTMEAYEYYRITRLSARVYELRHDDGYPIESRKIRPKKKGQNPYDEFYMSEEYYNKEVEN